MRVKIILEAELPIEGREIPGIEIGNPFIGSFWLRVSSTEGNEEHFQLVHPKDVALVAIERVHTYHTKWSKEDCAWVGTCDQYPSLSWLASTQPFAEAGIKKLVKEVEEEL